MRSLLLKVSLFAGLSNLLPSLLMASPTPTQGTPANEALTDLLRPYVQVLDRDLWTFRYQSKDVFTPKSIAEVGDNLSIWARRFFDPEVRLGADTGPGIYVATDPAATATWGRIHPRLFAIKIKQGSRVLIGDQISLPAHLVQSLRDLSKKMECGQSTTAINWDLGHAIGFFRMNETAKCREGAVQAIRQLSIQALSYGFNSATLPDCRVTGTAISIIDPNAIAMNEINTYAENTTALEGNPEATPFIKRLFGEAKDDYYAQSLIANLETYERYKRAYGFFDHAVAADEASYAQWKQEHILKCGRSWSIETLDDDSARKTAFFSHADPEAKAILVQLALIHRDKAETSLAAGVDLPRELEVGKVRAIRRAFPSTQENQIRLATAQVPTRSGDLVQDKSEYLRILNRCLQKYLSSSFADVVASECGPAGD